MQADAPEWLDVSRETLDKLQHYAAEVLRWNTAINLVSKAAINDLWQRHILDSAQIFPLAAPLGKWVDLGSGGGFPGLVVAIMGAAPVVLVESDQRKCAFLRQIALQLDLPVTVLPNRIDAMPPQAAQIVSARALASLTALLAHATPHLNAEGQAIFPKGRGHEDEVKQALETWAFDLVKHPSRTQPDAAILVIKNIRRRGL